MWKGFKLDGFYLQKDGGNPTGAYGTVFNDLRFKTSDGFAFGNLEYSRDLNYKMNLSCRAWLNKYKYRGTYPFDSVSGGLFVDQASTFWTGAETRYRWDMTSNNRLMVGGEFQQHFNSKYSTGYVSAIPYEQTTAFRTFAFYLQDEFQPIKNLTIIAGGRFDYLYRGKTALTPRLAVNFYPTKTTTFKAIYGEAFRAPNPYEVVLPDPLFATCNPNLKPEGIRTAELVWEQNISRSLFGVVSLYRNDMRNLIEEVLDTTTSTLLSQNVQRAGGFGGSAEINGRLAQGKGLNFYLNYTISSMRDIGEDIKLSNSPTHLLKGGISIPFLKHFRFSPEFFAESGRLNASQGATNAYAVFNANLLFAPKFEGGASKLNRFQLSFKVRNILDTDYRHPAGLIHTQPAIQQNGRNFNLKLRVSLF
jgi:outer membrane receptor for ferrienterochelin and colicins